MIARLVRLLPEPDSPMSPTTSPASILNPTPATAVSGLLVGPNSIRRLSTGGGLVRTSPRFDHPRGLLPPFRHRYRREPEPGPGGSPTTTRSGCRTARPQ